MTYDLDDPFARLAERYEAEHAAVTDPASLREELEADWRLWVPTLLPSYASFGFASHHEDFWEWVWQIERTGRPSPFVGVWARGGAKSTSAEAGLVALGARRKRRYALYCCHEVGTPIFDPDRPEDGWVPVESHPTAQVEAREGLSVRVAGLPGVTASETVTPDHRYWARRVASRQVKGVGQENVYGLPHWIESQHLDWNTWIGMPIDQTVSDDYPMLSTWQKTSPQGFQSVPFPMFEDPDFWWMVGLWWGDGTLGAQGGAAISFSCSDDHPNVRERLIELLRKWGYAVSARPGLSGARLVNVQFCDSALGRWLATWKFGNSRKVPPDWVERLDVAKQIALIRGYIAADGHQDDRGVHLGSIHLPGLLSVRRILARLGVVCMISSARSPGTSTFPGGRTYNTQRAYRLQIEHPAILGYPETQRTRRHELRAVFIRDGVLWSKVQAVEPAGMVQVVPIQTASETYLTAFGLSHNSMTQDQADKHVNSIAGMLESAEVAAHYPAMSERLVSKYGNSRGWRRNRLRTASGFTVDALGLDSASRGARVDEMRPDVVVVDDIDDPLDTPAAVTKKVELLTKSVLPLGTPNMAVIAIQNLIHDQSVFARLAGIADAKADFLADRTVSGPIPALDAMEWTERDGKYVLTAGVPTWEGQDMTACQAMVDTYGLSAFLSECQHETKPPAGGMFDHLVYKRIPWASLPKLVRVVVWVDPAVTDKDTSDSQGIQADGLGIDGKVYRLYSWEQRTSPQDAIRRALRKAVELGATTLGVETDQGGDTWYDTVAMARQYLRQEERLDTSTVVFAHDKAGAGHGPKAHRASLMLADYERGGIVHVEGTHTVLERALHRFPRVKPHDLVDSAYWSFADLRGGLSSGAYVDQRSAER